MVTNPRFPIKVLLQLGFCIPLSAVTVLLVTERVTYVVRLTHDIVYNDGFIMFGVW